MTDSRASSPTAHTYRSYLVRFWQSNEQGGWRASAQSVQSGITVLFGDVESLLAFLQSELKETPGFQFNGQVRSADAEGEAEGVQQIFLPLVNR